MVTRAHSKESQLFQTESILKVSKLVAVVLPLSSFGERGKKEQVNKFEKVQVLPQYKIRANIEISVFCRSTLTFKPVFLNSQSRKKTDLATDLTFCLDAHHCQAVLETKPVFPLQ